MKHTEETKRKISQSKKGCIPWNKGLKGYRAGKNHHWHGRDNSGDKNPAWKGGPEFWKKEDRRNDSGYIGWVKMIRERDNNKCKIADENCNGRLEVHHILSWRDFPELRYKINNGITLCHAHHPRARVEVKRLIPTFQELVSVSSEVI